MLTYNLDKRKYYSLYVNIRNDILKGNLKTGEKLPGKRVLADNLSVSVTTVQTAYEQLLSEGYIISSQRKGYFVADVHADFYGEPPKPTLPTKKKPDYKLDLVSGSAPAKLFPFSVWARLMRATLADEGEHLLERVPCDGDSQLKSAISEYLFRCRGVSVNPRYIVVGAGAEYLYGVIVQLLGRDKLFAVENPGFGKIFSAYKLNGAECVCVPVGKRGADCAAAVKADADVLHISPSHQYPTGAVMPAEDRARLIQWATENNKYIVEDDYDSEFRLYGKPLVSMLGLNRERVIYMNTFSKSLAPSMRMGYMVLPPALYDKFIRIFEKNANVVPLFEQKTLAAMISGGYFERHINRLKNHYRKIRQLLLEKIGSLPVKKEIFDTGSGLHLTVAFPTAENDLQIKSKALDMGINIRCLSDYLLEPLDGCEKIAIVNYSGVTQEQLEALKF